MEIDQKRDIDILAVLKIILELSPCNLMYGTKHFLWFSMGLQTDRHQLPIAFYIFRDSERLIAQKKLTSLSWDVLRFKECEIQKKKKNKRC